MKRLLRSLWSTMAVICLFMTSSVMLKASEENTFIQENYEVSEGELVIYAHKSGENLVSTDNMVVKLANQQIPITGISNFNMDTDAITYYCLVDVSGSLDAARMETIKEMINQLVLSMKDMDNMVVATIADDHTVSDYLSNKDELTGIVNQIEVTHQDTNLYYAVSEAIDSLGQNAKAHTKRCLIVFSDGADEQETGITKDEVIDKIKTSKIPVYTVAMLNPKKTDAQLEAAKILGSFARTSVGGVHYAPLLEEYEYDSVIEKIRAEISNTYKIHCELKDVELSQSTTELQTQWKLDDGSDYIDKLEIPSDRIRDYILITPIEVVEETTEVVEETTEVITEEVSTTEIMQEETQEGGFSPVIIIAIVAVVVIIVVVIIMICVSNNKKKAEEEARRQQEILAREEAERQRAEQQRRMEAERARASAPTPALQPAPQPKAPDIILKLVRLGTKKDEIIMLPITKECKFGRSQEKCDYAIPEDKSLSSLHCTFLYRNKKVYIRDEKSTNGTFINGVPLEGEHELNQDDVIYIGSYKYRIMW